MTKLTKLPFVSPQNFLDPQFTNDGKPYGPIRVKLILEQCYLLTRYLHISYTDVLKISPLEREHLLKLLSQEFEKSKKYIEEQRQKSS